MPQDHPAPLPAGQGPRDSAPIETPLRRKVLFLCVHNAGRSQMAAAFLREWAGDRLLVLSAGSEPAAALQPAVVTVMGELGIDLAGQTPRGLVPGESLSFDLVVTMGCGDACPVAPAARRIDWALPDPAGQGLAAVRAIRDRVRLLVLDLWRELLATEWND